LKAIAASLLATGALAVEQPAVQSSGPANVTSQSADTPSGTAAPSSPAAASSNSGIPQTTLDDVVVTAHTIQSSMAGGGMIAIQETPVVRTTIGQGFIDKQVAGQNSLSSIRFAPGVDVGQDNPFGVSERADLSVRGLDATQMGFVVEGMPVGDPNNYTPITNEWIDNENVKSVSITQGTSDLSSPVLSASGGLVDTLMRDPSHYFGGTVSESIGSWDTQREFIRLDSGDLGGTGTRMFVSYSHIGTDNFRGPGRSTRDHVDYKLVKDWDDGSHTSLVVTFNNLDNQRSSIPTLAQFQTKGTDSNYAGTYTFGQTQYYKFYPFIRQSVNVGAPTTVVIAPHLILEITPYFRYMFTNAPGGTLLPTSGLYLGNRRYSATVDVPFEQGGKFTAEALSLNTYYEAGMNSSLSYRTGVNELQFGMWYDHLEVKSTAPFVAVEEDGSVPSQNGNDVVRLSDGSTLLATDYELDRQVDAFYVADKINLLDNRLRFMFGIKELIESVNGRNYLPGATPVVGVQQVETTPRIGATYSFAGHSQLFFDVVTNARPPTPGPTYFDTFSVTTGAKTLVGNQSAKSEYSFQQEIGYRYQDVVNFAISAFHNVLYNHQVNSIVNENGSLLQSAISAGTEQIKGVDIEFGVRPYHYLSPYISGQYLDATTASDLPIGNDFLPTAGKVAVRSPRYMGAGGLTYDDGSLFSVIAGRYTGSQYSTFMNDQKLPAFGQVDFAIGYRFPNIGFAVRPRIQLNLINLLDASSLGSIASPTGNALPTVGRRGTLLAGSSPIYYENSTFTAMLTFKTDF
jgi:iron complex outermembrane receptor protein